MINVATCRTDITIRVLQLWSETRTDLRNTFKPYSQSPDLVQVLQ